MAYGLPKKVEDDEASQDDVDGEEKSEKGAHLLLSLAATASKHASRSERETEDVGKARRTGAIGVKLIGSSMQAMGSPSRQASPQRPVDSYFPGGHPMYLPTYPQIVGGMHPYGHPMICIPPVHALTNPSPQSLHGRGAKRNRESENSNKAEAEAFEVRDASETVLCGPEGKRRMISPSSSNEGHRQEDDDGLRRKNRTNNGSKIRSDSATPPPVPQNRFCPYPYPPAFPPAYGFNGAGYPPHVYYGVYPLQPPMQQTQGRSRTRPDGSTSVVTPSRPASSPSREISEESLPDRSPSSNTNSSSDVLLKSASALQSIKSVSGWQRSPMSVGKAPGARHRCIQLKPPIPSRYWGDSKRAEDLKLPDFNKLVNYPEFCARGRGGAGGDNKSNPTTPDGKKHCVMCGKLRLCSSNTAGSSRRSSSKSEETARDHSAGKEDDHGNDSAHIIPRQNKGVCTECDVAVWLVIDKEGLEIKWCKGCKNFRPWAAFGEKGAATKCVRCRTRQKEKYKMQKNDSAISTRSKVFQEEKKEDELAANGLRNLMKAS